MTDRDTVNKVERMKVTTCLNPLHTALAVYGCVLGYDLIADEMKDKELSELVKRIGLVEGMPVEEVIDKLEGITCGPRKTSCPDQLAKALKETIES